MTGPTDHSRRQLMGTLAGLSLSGASPASPAGSASARLDQPILVAYFSRSGNTRLVAGLIQRSLGADLFEILPASPYPADYLATVELARQERDHDIEPPLQARVPGLEKYATVFLGFPIWGETAPPVIRSFLAAHDLSGKTLVPFITHGGYGLGGSERVLAARAPRARFHRAFSMEADQERKTMDRVNGWMTELSTS